MKAALALAAALVAGPAGAWELPPCHPMLPPGFPCQSPALPPAGGVPQEPPVAACDAATPPGALCRWPVEARAVAVEVLGASSANPNEVAYAYTATLLLPRPPERDLVTLVGVLLLQINLQTASSCGTSYPHRYFESAFQQIPGVNCDPTEEP